MFFKASVILSFALVCQSPVLRAETAVWTNRLTTSIYGSVSQGVAFPTFFPWQDDAAWTQTDGETPFGCTPGAQAEDVELVDLGADARQTIRLGETYNRHAIGTNVVLRSLKADDRHYLNMHYNRYAGSNAFKPTLLSIADPDAFGGFIYPICSEAELRVPVAAGSTGTVASVSPNKTRMLLNVPNAGASVRLKELSGEGLLVKIGSGDLTVANASGLDSQLAVKAGSLTLEGLSADPEESPIPAGAWAHFDASATNTMTISAPAAGGRRYVTKWADADGGPITAAPNGNYSSTATYLVSYEQAPFVSPVVSPTGLPLLDFGAPSPDEVVALGPTNCMMELSAEAKNVRDVVYVGYFSKDRSYNAILGHNSDYPFHRGGQGWLFGADNAQSKYWAFGDLIYNGAPWLRDARFSITNLHVLSVGAAHDGSSFNMIATDRRMSGGSKGGDWRTGGVRIGEIFLFTNALTHAQRMRLSRHLVGKWLQKAPEDAIGSVNFLSRAETVGISVPAGRTATVGRLTTHGSTLVKTGGGTLNVGYQTDGAGTVSVEEGTVSFGGVYATPNADEPASDPYLHLVAGTNYIERIYPAADVNRVTNFVARWNDVRGSAQTDVYARLPTADETGTAGVTCGSPYLREGEATGHTVVDFGSSADDAAGVAGRSWMALSKQGQNAYCGFIVMRNMRTWDTSANIFGSTSYDLLRNGKILAYDPYAPDANLSARWTIDGVEFDPFTAFTAADYSAADYHVVAFRANAKLAADLLVKDRLKIDNCRGLMRIGEFILYDRKVTDDEFHQTEAYLMKKWLGRTHPLATNRVAALDFAANVNPTFAAEGTLAADTYRGGNGALVKSGAGAAAVGASWETVTNLISIAVTGGSLALALGLPDETIFHLDASDLSTLETFATDNGDGSVTTNLVSWSDVNANGMKATAYFDTTQAADKRISYTNPVWKAVETASGVWRPVVDFGEGSYIDKTPKRPSSASCNLSTRLQTVREVHLIYADNGVGSYNHVLTDTSLFHYHRGSSGALLGGSSAECAREGYVAIDGNACAYTDTTLADLKTHLVSFAPTDNTTIGTLARDRVCCGGNQRLGEMVVYDKTLPAEQRAFVQRHLMWKWLSDGTVPFWTNRVETVALANGSLLDLDEKSGVALSVGTLSGSGTIRATAILDVSALAFAVESPTEHDRLDVKGALALADPVTVTVTFAHPEQKISDDIPLLSADRLVAGGTLRLVTNHTRDAKLVVVDDVLCLRPVVKGLTLIFR